MWRAGPARRTSGVGRTGALRLGFALAPGQTVGVFGGSFDPAHAGHRHVAETARRRLALDRVIWLVSPQNPLKTSRVASPLAARLEGARAQARGPSMIVSDAETRIGARYTLDALRVLRSRYTGVRFVWLMGSDNLADFHRWRGWVDIVREFPIAVIARPGALVRSCFAPAARRFLHARIASAAATHLATAAAPAWTYLAAPLEPTTSTALRSRHHLNNSAQVR